MSFRSLYRRAADPSLELSHRYVALRSAISRYAALTQTSFSSVFTELRHRHRLLHGAPNQAEVIAAAAADLGGAREHFLTHLRAVAQRRRTNKRSPRRQREPPIEMELALGIVLGEPRWRALAAGAPRSPLVELPSGVPAPAFELGARVAVVVNDHNRTPRAGSIRTRVWHHKHGSWTYQLIVNGRKISKRYFEPDLKPHEPR